MPGAALRAGDLRDRYTFDQRNLDPNGAPLGAWGANAVTVAANTAYLHGSEDATAQRLQGVQPVLLTVRASSGTKIISSGWRAVDARDPTQVFWVTAAEITPDRAWMQILATTKKGQMHG